MNQLSREHVAPVKVTDFQHETNVLKKEINENRQQISYLEIAVSAIQGQIISKKSVETPKMKSTFSAKSLIKSG